MQKHAYEYAVIRVVPRVEREEFLNVGVVVFCKSAKFIRVEIRLEPKKLQILCPDCDLEIVQSNLDSFVRVANGGKSGGPIGSEEVPERFRWLTAQRSSVIQTSRPHPGLTTDLEETVKRLLEEYVL